jgi:large subunit ribosomal protein L6
MSIVNRMLTIPENVQVVIKNREVKDTSQPKEQEVEIIGPRGKLTQKIFPEVEVVKTENKLFTKLKAESKKRELVGTLNSLLYNALEGVTEGHQKELDIKGVGYKVVMKNNQLEFSLGKSYKEIGSKKFSQDLVSIPADLEVNCPENNQITVKGISKEKVGQFATQIKKLRRRSPYKLKGIYDKNEKVKLKTGKKLSK